MSRLVVELPRQYLQCKMAMWEWILAEYQPQYINESIERLTRLCLSEVLERAIIDFIQAGYTDLDYIEEWEDEHIRDLVGVMFDSATIRENYLLVKDLESALLNDSNFAVMVSSKLDTVGRESRYLHVYESLADSMNYVIQSAFEAFRPIETFAESLDCEIYHIPTHCYEVEIREQSRVLILGVA